MRHPPRRALENWSSRSEGKGWSWHRPRQTRLRGLLARRGRRRACRPRGRCSLLRRHGRRVGAGGVADAPATWHSRHRWRLGYRCRRGLEAAANSAEVVGDAELVASRPVPVIGRCHRRRWLRPTRADGHLIAGEPADEVGAQIVGPRSQSAHSIRDEFDRGIAESPDRLRPELTFPPSFQ